MKAINLPTHLYKIVHKIGLWFFSSWHVITHISLCQTRIAFAGVKNVTKKIQSAMSSETKILTQNMWPLCQKFQQIY